MSWENAQLILVGNKSDLSESRVISQEQGMDLASSLGIEYFETSAKAGTNVRQPFETLVDLISTKMAESIKNNPNLVPQGSKPQQLNNSQPTSSGCSC